MAALDILESNNTDNPKKYARVTYFAEKYLLPYHKTRDIMYRAKVKRISKQGARESLFHKVEGNKAINEYIDRMGEGQAKQYREQIKRVKEDIELYKDMNNPFFKSIKPEDVKLNWLALAAAIMGKEDANKYIMCINASKPDTTIKTHHASSKSPKHTYKNR